MRVQWKELVGACAAKNAQTLPRLTNHQQALFLQRLHGKLEKGQEKIFRKYYIQLLCSY